jgi:hypothetical protein
MELECLLPVIVYLKSHLSVKICKCWYGFDELMSAKSAFHFHDMPLLSPSSFPNLFQVKLNKR